MNDAAFRKGSKQHILGLFSINEKASAYTTLPSEEAIINTFLAELDEMFDSKASANYVKHIIQNWSEEPFIQRAYSYTFDGDQKQLVAAISKCLRYQVLVTVTFIVLAYIAGKVDITAIWRGTPRVFTLKKNRHTYRGFWLAMANL